MGPGSYIPVPIVPFPPTFSSSLLTPTRFPRVSNENTITALQSRSGKGIAGGNPAPWEPERRLSCRPVRGNAGNVAAGRSAWPIQPMSVGKPNRSGTAANRLQTAVASRDGLAAGAKGQGRPVCLSDQIDAALTPTKLLEPYGDPEILGPPELRATGGTAAFDRFSTRRLAFEARRPTESGRSFLNGLDLPAVSIPINNCVPSGSLLAEEELMQR